MEKIYECFENIGVFIPDEEKNSDLFLEEYSIILKKQIS